MLTQGSHCYLTLKLLSVLLKYVDIFDFIILATLDCFSSTYLLVSYQSDSETVFINPIDIPALPDRFGDGIAAVIEAKRAKNEFEDEAVASALEVFTVVDSPGFGDTHGVELDISNGQSISSAMRRCRGIWPLILFSSNSIGDRLEGFGNYTYLLKLLHC